MTPEQSSGECPEKLVASTWTILFCSCSSWTEIFKKFKKQKSGSVPLLVGVWSYVLLLSTCQPFTIVNLYLEGKVNFLYWNKQHGIVRKFKKRRWALLYQVATGEQKRTFCDIKARKWQALKKRRWVEQKSALCDSKDEKFWSKNSRLLTRQDPLHRCISPPEAAFPTIHPRNKYTGGDCVHRGTDNTRIFGQTAAFQTVHPRKCNLRKYENAPVWKPHIPSKSKTMVEKGA